MKPLSLSAYLAQSGVASRRKCADIVRAGRVAINGRIVSEPGCKVGEGDRVAIDGRIVAPIVRHHYIMLNKPRGYVSTMDDRHALLKAIDLIDLPDKVRLFSAGRLDKESEGLLIFSDDGDYVAKLTHPRYEILKRYRVGLSRELTVRELDAMRAGITENGEFLKPRKIVPLGGKNYEITLNEGKKREIRRLTAFFGAPTLSLRRISTGKLLLGDLPEGKFRELSPEEVALSLIPSPEL
ncbi:MAG: rRNA pseudouridine synthase [Victivallaceae bacterium]|nr:rRNA pseudouridine synthase [Victivallaceae bacterium]